MQLAQRNVRILGLSAVVLLAASCTPPVELDANDLGPTIEWQELIGSPDKEEEVVLPTDARALSRPPVEGPQLLTPQRLALLPMPLREKPVLARLVVAKALENPIAYQGGAYGLIGPAKVFVTTRDHIKDDNRLYWVMVKVLSEKYGCFMTSKINLKDSTRVTCRDKRRIVFWRTRGDHWVQFLARQYDTQGYEIVVRKRQIVRIGKERVL